MYVSRLPVSEAYYLSHDCITRAITLELFKITVAVFQMISCGVISVN